jgi:hypothetical protein
VLNHLTCQCSACSTQDCTSNLLCYCPTAVADELWFQPTKSAVCGMCLKISISPGMPSPTCTDSTAQTATCPGSGTTPYTSVNQPWAWNATVYPADANNPLPYFIAVIIEWFDRCATWKFALLVMSCFGVKCKLHLACFAGTKHCHMR